MPKIMCFLTVETLDGSPLDIDAMARALGKSSITLAIYTDEELERNLRAVKHRRDLRVTARAARDV